MNVLNQRQVFAEFLERLALGEVKSEDWQTLVVNHYFDDVIEKIRLQLVRFTIQSPEPHNLSEEERTQLMIWINELGS